MEGLMSSNAPEARHASETRLTWWACAAGLLAGALLVGTAAAVRLHRAPAGELAPDPAAVHYRYPLGGPPVDTGATIAALEARIRAMPSPFDYAELAELYVRRAQLDGEPDAYRTAEAMARRSLELLPAPNPAVLTLAKVADARHEFRDAIDLAHRHHGRSAGAQIVLATAHLALGELADAGEAARAALALKPDSAGHLMRALVLQAQGRDPEAALAYASAARVEEPGDLPASARLRTLWARFLLRRGEPAGAERLLDEALRIAPGFALATAVRAELALRTGRARDAAAQFEQAFIASRQVRYLIDQARAQELAGELAAADALRAQVESIIRGDLGAGGFGHRLELVEVLVDRGRPAGLAEAVALAREEASRRASFEARFQLARALARSGDRAGATHEVEAALASGAHEAQLYELAAQLAAQRGDPAAAALYTQLADRFDPDRPGGPRGTAWRKLGLRPVR
jgi:Tfp pilus assembly protein PilF